MSLRNREVQSYLSLASLLSSVQVMRWSSELLHRMVWVDSFSLAQLDRLTQRLPFLMETLLAYLTSQDLTEKHRILVVESVLQLLATVAPPLLTAALSSCRSQTHTLSCPPASMSH